MSNKPKIGVIGLKGLPAFGGAATVGENIIEQLKDKYVFTVYSDNSHTDLQTGDYKGYKQVVFNTIKCTKLNALLYYIKSMFMVMFGNYDLVHLHHRDAAFIIPFLRLRNKVILTTHGTQLSDISKWEKMNWFFNSQLKYFAKYANIITCVSKIDQCNLKNNYFLSSFYIPNGILLNTKSKHFEQTDYIFFSAGRIMHSKGCHVLLQALNSIEYKGKIIIAGSLEQEKKYSAHLESLSQNLNTEYLGLVKDKAVLLGILRGANLFIFPSFNESMSMMLLEAVAMKTPIISSNIKANTDIFENNEMLFFENMSVEDLAIKINWAMENNDKMNQFAINAFVRAEMEYNWSNIASQYKELYENLLLNED